MAKGSILTSTLFRKHGLTGLFTQRLGGISPPPFDSFNFGSGLGDPEANIEANLKILIHAAGLTHAPHQVNQVHGNKGLRFEGPGCQHSDEADILVASHPGTALAVRTADCLPLLLADASNGVIAAIHAGWRGTVAKAANRGIEEMCRLGADRSHIIATLGPCIGPCCFTVGEDTAALLAGCCHEADAFIERSSTIKADLRAINRLQLLQGGIDADRIETINACTACQPHDYFSYRRDGKQSGRHLAVVALPTSP